MEIWQPLGYFVVQRYSNSFASVKRKTKRVFDFSHSFQGVQKRNFIQGYIKIATIERMRDRGGETVVERGQKGETVARLQVDNDQ